MRSHTVATISLGKGSVYSISTKQKINTKSSTEAELVGVDDGMPLVVWTRKFLISQGFQVTDNVIYQDNQGATLLERNGRSSTGRHIRHIEIMYFFITDQVKAGELSIHYCPTGDMVADFFTKPLQGSQFKNMQSIVMHLTNDVPLPVTSCGTQECVGRISYADVIRGQQPGDMVRQSSDVMDNKQTVDVTKQPQHDKESND